MREVEHSASAGAHRVVQLQVSFRYFSPGTCLPQGITPLIVNCLVFFFSLYLQARDSASPSTDD